MTIFRLQLQAKLKTNKWKSTKLQEIVKVSKNVLWWPSTWYVTNIYLAAIKSVTLDQFPNTNNVFKTILCNACNLSEMGINCPIVSVTISLSYAYHNRTDPTFSLNEPLMSQWHHYDITYLWHHYDITYLWHHSYITMTSFLHLTPLRRHHQNTINTHRHRSFNLTCSYLVTW